MRHLHLHHRDRLILKRAGKEGRAPTRALGGAGFPPGRKGMHVHDRRIRRALVVMTAAAMAVPFMPAAPAAAQGHDCTIMGPYYVEEAVDCVYFVLSMIAIGDIPPN